MENFPVKHLQSNLFRAFFLYFCCCWGGWGGGGGQGLNSSCNL